MQPNPLIEQILIRFDGSSVPVEVASAPFMYQGIKSVQAIVHDISEKKKYQDESIKAQKLESLGVLAGGIAHDFNNILTSILGNISLARMQLHESDKVEQRLAEAEKASIRAKDLTQQLLTFAKGGEPVKKIVKIDGLLKEAAAFAIHGSSVTCEFVLPENIWPVEADEGQLSQVVHNLVLNAVQAMPQGGRITLRAGNIAALPGGDSFVKISVTDTGVGIPEQYLPRIFDPYFTTKQQGSGLGLATCHSIIHKHGGKIWAESAFGKGTTFCIELPTTATGDKEESKAPMEAIRGSGRVLIMDDEEQVRLVAQAMLEDLGYTVECAKDGSEAVEVYRNGREDGTPFDVIIMDLTIPGGIGGKEAITELLRLDPNAKVVVSSGYSDDPVVANYKEYGFCAVLSKPYRLQEMSLVLFECRSREELQPSLFDT
jgi:nitrogen-specific signal transduction histidine kinase/CheY-like chemotaxis protein